MKKLKTTLLTGVMAILAISPVFLSSCKEEEKQETVENSSSIVELNGFDTHTDLDTLWFQGALGKMELNKTETQYIRSGVGSAKVTVDSNPYKDWIPRLIQATEQTKKELDFTDFSFVKFVSLDVYNAQTVERKIELQLDFDSSTGPKETFTLAPSAWTTVRYAVDREYIPTVYNVNNEQILKVSGINLFFERGETDETYYLDDMHLYKTSMPAMPISMELAENEFCSFDALWQTKLLEKTDWSDTSILPVLSYTSEVTSTGKGGALQMIAPAGDDSTAGGFAGIVFSDKQIAMFPWAQYDENDCFCFDVYAPKEGGIQRIWFNMYGETTTRFFVAEIEIPLGKWTTVSFPISQLNSSTTVTELDYFGKTKMINITYMSDTTERVIYFDNFRVEVN